MVFCREIGLGEEAGVYMRERLAAYGHALGRKVASTLDFTAGRIYTYMPAEYSVAMLKDFEHATVKWPEELQRATLAWYVDIAHRFLASGERRVHVLENNCARANDPYQSIYRSNIVTFCEILYHVCFGGSGCREIEKAVLEASGWISPGFMTLLRPGWDRDSRRFSLGDLEYMAGNTEKVVVDAYDGEGWLIWERDR